MTTATVTISPTAKMFLLPSHHHHNNLHFHHHPHHAKMETPAPSLTPPPQSPEDAVAEVEAEVEQFRRQLYLRRGLSYPGPTATVVAVPRQNPAIVAQQQHHFEEFPKMMVGLSPVASTATVITGTTTTATTIASTAAAVEPSSPPPSLSSSVSSSSSSSPSITTSTSPTSSNNNRLPKTFSQLVEDLIRTHSSTASPSGQKYSRDLLQGTIGHDRDTMFGGDGTYFGSFT